MYTTFEKVQYYGSTRGSVATTPSTPLLNSSRLFPDAQIVGSWERTVGSSALYARFLLSREVPLRALSHARVEGFVDDGRARRVERVQKYL